MRRLHVAIIAGLLSAACMLSQAQSASCLSDPNRHAQLAEQDAAQLYELQALYGAREVTQRTQQVFNRLVDAQLASDPASFAYDWRLAGYGALSINAHAMHTGRIVVTQGLDSPDVPEDILAASLAHEISHVVQHHGLTQACFALEIINPSVTLRQAQTDLMQEVWSSGQELGLRVRSLAHTHEFQADAGAIELLRRAGYPGNSMSGLLVFLMSRNAGGPTWQSGSHPDQQLRLAKAREAEALMPRPDMQAPRVAQSRSAR